MDDVEINFALGIGLLILSFMFLKGFFQADYHKDSKFTKIIDIDVLIFPDKKELILEANKLAFWICILMSLFTFLNGILIIFFRDIINISAIFMFIGFVGSWLGKYSFLLFYKNKSLNEIPNLWPKNIKR